MKSAARYVRNIQGHSVALTLIEVSPDDVVLDPSNPRIGFSIRQLEENQKNEAACDLLLTSQEETEALKRSIILSNGVQEPIYLRANRRVAEGNRRVVAMRAAKEEFPQDKRFRSMPAWLIPAKTPEHVIQDLLNEIHIGSVRGWAPYEKALQMKALLDGGLIEEEVAERYRVTAREVRQQIAAVEMFDNLYFPSVKDPTDPEHRTKFSYFLEFCKNGKLQARASEATDLRERFAVWVRDGRVDTGAKVRRLPKILDSKEATRLLELVGFDDAEEYLAREHPEEQELYATIERTRSRLSAMTVSELVELAGSPDRKAIFRSLHDEIGRVLKAASRVRKSA